MTTASQTYRLDESNVKQSIISEVSELISRVLDAAESGSSPRELELSVWKVVLLLGQLLLAHAFAIRCRRAMLSEVSRRGLEVGTFRVRNDDDYCRKLVTSFGPVRFPTYALRIKTPAGSSTIRPADGVFPLSGRCRSTEVCVEMSARLASIETFRNAQSLLTFFTHGGVELEDTTIARHAVCVGHSIDPSWLYKPREELLETLRTRATLDSLTGRPIIYMSSDAHALRRYVDESWNADWKMVNGFRVWCVDRDNGSIIHIGGQFTCGDCAVMRQAVVDLISSGYLPVDGDFGDGLQATYVFVCDGMPWLKEHLIDQFPGATAVLDAYHVLEKLAVYAAARFTRGSHQARQFLKKAKTALFGESRDKQRGRQSTRRGHTKSSRTDRTKPILPDMPDPEAEGSAALLLKILDEHDDQSAEHQTLVGYVTRNEFRMDYRRYRARGFQIGSGAMESLHRTASQVRTKRAGVKWLAGTLQALFNLRMLQIVDRWTEFFAQPDLWHTLNQTFQDVTYNTARGPWGCEVTG